MYASDIPILRSRFIGIAGDWHGFVGWIREALKAFERSGIKTVIQLGDFGLMDDIPRYVNKINSYLIRMDIDLLVIPGNHENYSFINDDSKFHIDEYGIRWLRLSSGHKSKIGLLPRGFSWEQNGHSIMALGGASSIDFENRKEGRSWWSGENISEEEADRIIDKLDGSTIDVMLCHDAPLNVVTLEEYELLNDDDEDGWSEEGRIYAGTSRARLDRVFRNAQPSLLMHGHWHTPVDEHGEFEKYADPCNSLDENTEIFHSRIFGLDMQHSDQNIAVLDTVTLAVSSISVKTVSASGRDAIYG